MIAEEMPAWAVRLEAKIDVALAGQAGTLANHDEKLAEAKRDSEILEGRIRQLEARRCVTPGQLGATALGILSAIAAAAPFLDQLYS